jgi:hypothetical protein
MVSLMPMAVDLSDGAHHVQRVMWVQWPRTGGHLHRVALGAPTEFGRLT